MPSKLSKSLAVLPLALLLVNWSGPTLAAQVNLEKWRLIRIVDPAARRAAIAALEAAATQLEEGDCRKVLTDFRNGNGATLADQLSSLGVDIQAYFAMITFIDTRHRLCEGGAVLFTTPGSRVVRVCIDELKRLKGNEPNLVALFIHEILHTLGLREDPPSSQEITARVLARCGRK